MRELLVMRHAKSDWSVGASDFNRPLNDRGVLAADAMSNWIVDQGLVPDLIISSPAVRTRSTAQTVAAASGMRADRVLFTDDLYLADEFTWRQSIAVHGGQHTRVLICGHNPGLDYLVDHLASTPAALTASGKLMTTAAVAYFRLTGDWTELGQRAGELVSLTRPADLD